MTDKTGVAGGRATLGAPALGIVQTPIKKIEPEDKANDKARDDKDDKDPS